jgi:hypothetical protein
VDQIGKKIIINNGERRKAERMMDKINIIELKWLLRRERKFMKKEGN